MLGLALTRGALATGASAGRVADAKRVLTEAEAAISVQEPTQEDRKRAAEIIQFVSALEWIGKTWAHTALVDARQWLLLSQPGTDATAASVKHAKVLIGEAKQRLALDIGNKTLPLPPPYVPVHVPVLIEWRDYVFCLDTQEGIAIAQLRARGEAFHRLHKLKPVTSDPILHVRALHAGGQRVVAVEWPGHTQA